MPLAKDIGLKCCFRYSDNVVPMSSSASFSKLVQFSCTACGRCCRVNKELGGSSRIRVHLNEKEVAAIANHMNISKAEFKNEFTEVHNDIPDHGPLLTLKTQVSPFVEGHSNESAHCVLFDSTTNRCRAYSVRPTQCRTYPFWPQFMTGAADWNAEAAHQCEGMKPVSDARNTPAPMKSTSAAPAVAPQSNNTRDSPAESSLEPLLNLVIHQLHDRGRGEWTYDEARQLLWESNGNDQATLMRTLAEYEEEFLSLYGSSIGA